MIYRNGIDAKTFLDNMLAVSTVIKEDDELKEVISGDVCIPKVKSLSKGYDIDSVPYVNISDECEIDSLLALNATHRGGFSLIMLNSPTDYNDKCFYYNGNYVPRYDSYYNTKVAYYMYNRLKIAHSLLAEDGIVTILVTESFLNICRQIADEVFGTKNQITTHIVVHNKAGSGRNGVLLQHQYVLVYAKSRQSAIQSKAYKLSENTLFSVSKSTLYQGLSDAEGLKNGRNFEDAKSSFDTVSFIRAQKRKENDNNFYPIYYVLNHANFDEKSGLDLYPRLTLDPTGLPNEFEILPIDDKGVEKVWNCIPTTFLNESLEDNFCVRVVNGVPKIYMKVRDANINGEAVEPVKTLLEEGMSNLTTGTKIRNLMGDKEQYVGYNPNLSKYLISAYSRESDKVLSIGDKCMTVCISNLEYKLNRHIYTTIIPSQTNLKKYLNALLSEYDTPWHHFINFELDRIPNAPMLEFTEYAKSLQEGIATLKYLGMAELYKGKEYTIYETKSYDLLITLNTRYDLEVYLDAKKRISELKQSNNVKIIVWFVDDSQYCQGQEVLGDADFYNMLQSYKFTYDACRKSLLICN